MSFMPGWASLDSTSSIAHWLHISAIAILGLLVAAEGLALIYDSHKETLAAAAERLIAERHQHEQQQTESQHETEVSALQKRTEKAEGDLAKLRKSQLPRILKPEQNASLTATAREFVGQKFEIVTRLGDDEALALNRLSFVK